MNEIDYYKVFEVLPRVMGIQLRRERNYWYGACYMNGAPHKRTDKLVCRIAPRGDGIQILEAGGDAISLWSWLKQYGGCSTNRDVFKRLTTLSTGVIAPVIVSEKRGLYVPYYELEEQKGLPLRDNLYAYLCGLFGKDKVDAVYDLYNVTSTWMSIGQFATCFWYVDRNNNVCHDKFILYGTDGHRSKKFGGGRKFKTKDGYSYRCLFGEHLLGRKGRVVVVESEKTALLMALRWPQHTYLATGGVNHNFYIDSSWELWPDNDEAGMTWIEKWPKQCKKWWEKWTYAEKGWDIGDIIINEKITQNGSN